MTDAEIIRALECCSEANSCCQCEYESDEYRKGTIGCSNAIMKEALDLINRQKAEIERLKSILLCFMDEVEKWENKHCLDVSELPLIPIKGETEKIKKQIRAEAIKEFAERLKENTIDVDVSYGYGREHYTEAVAVIEIDNLVKEMAGDTE